MEGLERRGNLNGGMIGREGREGGGDGREKRWRGNNREGRDGGKERE